MVQTLLLLPHHLVLDLHAGTSLLLLEVALLLFLGFLLLRFDHLLEGVVLHVLLLLLHLEEVLLLSLFVLEILHVPLNLLLKAFLVPFDVALQLLLERPVLGLPLSLFFLFLPLSLQLLLHVFDVSLSLLKDVLRLLLGLINLLPGFLLLLLEQLDSVRQQLHVFLSPLSGNLGGNQLPVQGFIVVVLVNVQVHFLELLLLTLVGLLVLVLGGCDLLGG